jgi:ATP-binding cassette subfamily B protein
MNCTGLYSLPRRAGFCAVFRFAFPPRKMTTTFPSSSTKFATSHVLPPDWETALMAVLQAGETMDETTDETAVAWVETDLDAQLHFAAGIVVLTDRRLLGCDDSQKWQSWPMQAGLTLRHFDHAGVGTLELDDASGRLASWRFTLAQNVDAVSLLDAFERRIESITTGQPPRPREENVCPQCKAVLEPGEEECPICSREIHAPPSTWTLLRLWRFARPYRGQLLTGFVLTLIATAANMVPPYLAIPLMDDVLIPCLLYTSDAADDTR